MFVTFSRKSDVILCVCVCATGSPDNIRALPDGSGLQVALYVAHGEDEPILARSLAATPVLRKFIVRVQYLIQTAFEFLNQQYPHVFFENAIYSVSIHNFFACLLLLVDVHLELSCILTVQGHLTSNFKQNSLYSNGVGIRILITVEVLYHNIPTLHTVIITCSEIIEKYITT